MLKIKLTRVGKKNQPSYRIVVAEARSKINGQYLTCLGYYNPLAKPPAFTVNRKAFDQWMVKGAQPTERVKKLLVKFS